MNKALLVLGGGALLYWWYSKQTPAVAATTGTPTPTCGGSSRIATTRRFRLSRSSSSREQFLQLPNIRRPTWPLMLSWFQHHRFEFGARFPEQELVAYEPAWPYGGCGRPWLRRACFYRLDKPAR